jgi:hypothetical protein
MVTHSEPSAVTGLGLVGGWLLVGTTAGLERWDLTNSTRARIGEAEGLKGNRVRALAPIPGTQQAWVATPAVLARWDAATGKATALPAPVADKQKGLSELRVLQPDPKGGVWAGGKAGLFHVDGEGVWTSAGYNGQVTALYVGPPNDTLWVGTPDGVLERNRGGVFTRYGEKEGLGIAWVTHILAGPQGETVVVGYDAKGGHQLAFSEDGGFSTFRLSPSTPIVAAARRPGELLLVVPGRVLSVSTAPPGADAGRELVRNGLHLTPVMGKRRRPLYRVAALPSIPPPDVTQVIATGAELFAGTRSVGTARLSLGARQEGRVWFRQHELVDGAISLTVACKQADDCYVTTGGKQAWRFDGKVFSPVVVQGAPKEGVVALAAVRAPNGDILLLYRGPNEHGLHVAKKGADAFIPDATLQISTPSGVTLLSFARFSPDGLLWVGLEYLDEEGDSRPFGVATIDLSLNVVSYHHEDARDAKATGVLPVPNDVVDAAFLDDEIWFASKSGAARIKKEQITIWSEADELRSEILHGVVATEGGVIYVASSSGVGEYDGHRWTYPKALSIRTNAIARGLDGRLWLGTPRGLVVFDGKTTARYDRRDGLLDEVIEDIAADEHGRIWARSDAGLTVVFP